MSIFTAPLFDLVGRSSLIDNAVTFGPENEPSGQGQFLKFGTMLSIILIVAGIYFIYAGVAGDVEIETTVGTLKSNVVGLALTMIGAALYLGIGKILLSRNEGQD